MARRSRRWRRFHGPAGSPGRGGRAVLGCSGGAVGANAAREAASSWRAQGQSSGVLILHRGHAPPASICIEVEGRCRNAASSFGSRIVLHLGAVPVPVLDGGGLVAGADVEVGDDERVGVDRVGEFGQQQRAVRGGGCAAAAPTDQWRPARDRGPGGPAGSAAGWRPATSSGSIR